MPTTSSRYAGPIGQPNCFSITLSILRKSAPSRSNRLKPAKYGNSTRLTKKPGQSLTTIGVLPILLAQATTFAMVSSELFSPRIISTNGIRWTGLKKCIPQKFSGRSSALASSLIGMVEVLDASTVFGRTFCSVSGVIKKTAKVSRRKKKTPSLTTCWQK